MKGQKTKAPKKVLLVNGWRWVLVVQILICANTVVAQEPGRQSERPTDADAALVKGLCAKWMPDLRIGTVTGESLTELHTNRVNMEIKEIRTHFSLIVETNLTTKQIIRLHRVGVPEHRDPKADMPAQTLLNAAEKFLNVGGIPSSVELRSLTDDASARLKVDPSFPLVGFSWRRYDGDIPFWQDHVSILVSKDSGALYHYKNSVYPVLGKLDPTVIISSDKARALAIEFTVGRRARPDESLEIRNVSKPELYYVRAIPDQGRERTQGAVDAFYRPQLAFHIYVGGWNRTEGSDFVSDWIVSVFVNAKTGECILSKGSYE